MLSMALRKVLILRACEGIGLEPAISRFSPRRPGESRDPSFRYSGVFKQWQCLADPEMFLPRRDGPRLCAGVTGEWAAAGFLHNLLRRPQSGRLEGRTALV